MALTCALCPHVHVRTRTKYPAPPLHWHGPPTPVASLPPVSLSPGSAALGATPSPGPKSLHTGLAEVPRAAHSGDSGLLSPVSPWPCAHRPQPASLGKGQEAATLPPPLPRNWGPPADSEAEKHRQRPPFLLSQGLPGVPPAEGRAQPFFAFFLRPSVRRSQRPEGSNAEATAALGGGRGPRTPLGLCKD